MKLPLAIFLVLIVIFPIAYSFHNLKAIKTNALKNQEPDEENEQSIEVDAFYPNERIRKYGPNMAKYFTRFAKLSYCDFQIFTSNPLCEKIMEEWKLVYSTRRVKVLSSKMSSSKSQKKKMVFTCSSPRKYFNFEEKNLIYSDASKAFNSTYFGAFNFFVKIYEKLIPKVTEEKLFNQIKLNINATDTQIFFVGHSYGAVICNILALRASELNEYKTYKQKDSPILLTYGAPNIGGKTFADNIESRVPLVYRIVSNIDALPTYPRTTELDKSIKTNKWDFIKLKDYGKHIVINNDNDNHYLCPILSKSSISKRKNSSTSLNSCLVKTHYVSYNNMFYFQDNLANISPNAEYNKVWTNGASIGSMGYAST